MLTDCLKGKSLLFGILAFAHKTYAGDQPVIAPDQRIQIRLQKASDILTEIGRMAAVATIDAVGDRQCEADLPRDLS